MMVNVVETQSCNFPQFGLLHDIIVYGQQPIVLFVFDVMDTMGYDANMGAYVICSSPVKNYVFI